MQAPIVGHIRGELSSDAAAAPAISLDLDDIYLPDEPVTIGARLLNMDVAPGAVRAVVRRTDGITPPVRLELGAAGDDWSVETTLAPGLYEIEVKAVRAGFLPDPVHDVFEVGG